MLVACSGCGLQVTYDIYQPFIAPKASPARLLLVSRITVALAGLIQAVASVIFYKASANCHPS